MKESSESPGEDPRHQQMPGYGPPGEAPYYDGRSAPHEDRTQYDQPPQYGQQPPAYAQAPHGQPPYGQERSAYGPPPYGRDPYGQDPYAQGAYGPAAYGQYGQPAYDPAAHPQQGVYGQPSYPPPAYGQQAAYYGYAAYPPGYAYPRPTNSMAIASLVCAFVFSPLGIIFGVMARRQIKQSGEQGWGIATAGLWVSVGLTTLFVLIFVIWLVAVIAIVSSAPMGGVS